MTHVGKNSQQSFDCMPMVITKKEQFVDQAEQIGFIRAKFFHWLSSISEELLQTQTLEYWILSYVSETATATTNVWDEVISPDAWLSTCFAISLETAKTIVNGVSADYLKKQTQNIGLKIGPFNKLIQHHQSFSLLLKRHQQIV